MIFPIKINEMNFTCGGHNTLANERLKRLRGAAHLTICIFQAVRPKLYSEFSSSPSALQADSNTKKQKKTPNISDCNQATQQHTEKWELPDSSLGSEGQFSVF